MAEFLRKLSNNGLSTEVDRDTYRDFQDKRDFIVQSLIRDIRGSESNLARVVNEIQELMGHLGFQLETMTGIDLVIARMRKLVNIVH